MAVCAAAQHCAYADASRALVMQKHAVILGLDERREASCEAWAQAYQEEASDERGYRAAHCFERVGDYARARELYEKLAQRGELREVAVGSAAQIEGTPQATLGVTPFELALASPLHFYHPPRKAIWGFALTVFYSATEVHAGFEGGLGVARVREYFRGVSIDGLAHWVQGSAAGVQISGFGNFCDRAWGVELAGGGNVSREFGGLMVSGVWNRGDDVSGVQIALLNQAHVRFSGLQIGALNVNNVRFVTAAPGRVSQSGTVGSTGSGGVNYSTQGMVGPDNLGSPYGDVASSGESTFVDGTSFGMQLGVVNYGQAVRGTQLGAFNYASEVTGLQIGVVNAAQHLHGLQLGLLNIAVHNPLPFMVIANFGL